MSLTFSVITPSYNQGQFIERTIQSVLSQDDVELEYLVCDGGSSDQTIDVLRQYQHRLRWVSEPDGGQTDAVNKGIQQTTGDIIAWINSDDIYYPSALNRVQHIFETHPEVQVVYGNAYHIDENDGVIEPYPTAPWNYQILKEVCFLCQPATFFRRSLVEEQGLLDASLKFCMDYELWLRYGRITNFFYLPEVLAGSRLYQDTKTLGQRVAVHYEINEMMVKKFTFSPEKWVLAYASVLVDDQDKARGRDLTNLSMQVQRTNEFFLEAFRGYRRWRRLMMSPATAWMLGRWVAASYYRLLKHQLSLKVHL
jgi:glycosyltransferase involved in cell wall biosynthesis